MRNATFILVLVFLALACKETRKAEQSTKTLDSLEIKLNLLNDSLEVAWRDMMASDDQKIRHIKTLSGRIADGGGYSKPLYDSVVQSQVVLSAKRYQNPDQFTAQQVDAYDSATDSLVRKAKELHAQAAPKCTDCDDLVNRIMDIDNQVVIYRIRYDGHAKEYNTFIKENKDKLAQLNARYQKLVPKPLFQLAPQ